MPGQARLDYPVLRGGGAMGRAIAAHDWAATPLGAISGWPSVLKISAGTMLQSAFPKCLCWGDDLTMIYNDAFVPILGRKHPCLGMPFLEVWQETAESLAPITARALAGEATFIEDFEIHTTRSGTMESAFFTFCYSPVRDETGLVRGMLDTVVETTAKVKATSLAQLRNRELVHRSRNAYALVSALVNLTFRSGRPSEEIKSEIHKRIAALVRAQDLLMEAGATRGLLRLVAERALEPFEDGSARITITGPDIAIGREQVTALSLALHELATNSIKYGALGSLTGQVTLGWQVIGTRFRMDWTERGGPPVQIPATQGFGSRIIRYTLPEAFGGALSLEFAPEGLHLGLTTTVDRLLADDPFAADAVLPDLPR